MAAEDLEAAAAAIQHQSLTTATELWRPEDVAAFVQALHSIRHKAPNGGFKPPHYREALQLLSKEVPDGMPKTPEQLGSKYQDVS